MSARDLFVSSPIPWFANHADEVIDAIANESRISRDMFRRDDIVEPSNSREYRTISGRIPPGKAIDFGGRGGRGHDSRRFLRSQRCRIRNDAYFHP